MSLIWFTGLVLAPGNGEQGNLAKRGIDVFHFLMVFLGHLR